LTNLLAETEKYLRDLHFKPSDVAWVGASDGRVASSWDRFAALVHGLEYDAGYGAQEIASDLVVVFKDGSWLERDEYDGSEGWAYKHKPLLQLGAKPLVSVVSEGWDGRLGRHALDPDEPEPGVIVSPLYDHEVIFETKAAFNDPFAAP
jgi:hypothetical protein